MGSLGQRIKALLGVSAYQAATPAMGLALDSAQVEQQRETYGGQLAPMPFTQLRWLLSDLESAQAEADAGIIQQAAKLSSSCKRDGIFAGALSTRSNGLVRLDKRFRGSPEMVAQLQLGHESVRSVFDEMFPPSELALLVEDGIMLGIGVAELVPVEGRSYPVMVRLPPENLMYRWSENRWYYRSIVGLLPVTPGDGRWILHVPGGRIAPWQSGLWRAMGRAFINKEHALLHDANWQAKLAHPARVAFAPKGATDEMQLSWFQKVAAWGMNTVFGLKPGYDIKLLESNGRGHESFDATIKRSEREFVIGVSGQEVTTDGGSGFQNSDIFKSIRSDLIQCDAIGLAYTINTQGIPPWTVRHFGLEALEQSPCVEWNVTPPRDRNAEATAYMQIGNAINVLLDAVKRSNADNGTDIHIELPEILTRFNVPASGDMTAKRVPGLVNTTPEEPEELADEDYQEAA